MLPQHAANDGRSGVRLVESGQQADGRWLLERAYDESLAFPFGEREGEPSRWNTLRALRVLRRYEHAQRYRERVNGWARRPANARPGPGRGGRTDRGS